MAALELSVAAVMVALAPADAAWRDKSRDTLVPAMGAGAAPAIPPAPAPPPPPPPIPALAGRGQDLSKEATWSCNSTTLTQPHSSFPCPSNFTCPVGRLASKAQSKRSHAMRKVPEHARNLDKRQGQAYSRPARKQRC